MQDSDFASDSNLDPTLILIFSARFLKFWLGIEFGGLYGNQVLFKLGPLSNLLGSLQANSITGLFWINVTMSCSYFPARGNQGSTTLMKTFPTTKINSFVVIPKLSRPTYSNPGIRFEPESMDNNPGYVSKSGHVRMPFHMKLQCRFFRKLDPMKEVLAHSV